jgi:hypothetical protein
VEVKPEPPPEPALDEYDVRIQGIQSTVRTLCGLSSRRAAPRCEPQVTGQPSQHDDAE